MKMRNAILIAAGFSFTLLQSQTIEDGRRQTRNEQYEDAGKTFELLIVKNPTIGPVLTFLRPEIQQPQRPCLKKVC